MRPQRPSGAPRNSLLPLTALGARKRSPVLVGDPLAGGQRHHRHAQPPRRAPGAPCIVSRYILLYV